MTDDGPVTAAYASRFDERRPTVVTALGVVSICVAAMGLLVGLVHSAVWIVDLSLRAAASAETVTMPTATPGVRTTSVVTPEQAGIVADALDSLHPLDEGARARLVKALPLVRVPFLVEDDDWTVEAVKALSTGFNYSNNGGDVGFGGYAEYSFDEGTIDVNDDGTISVFDWTADAEWSSAVVGENGSISTEPVYEDNDYDDEPSTVAIVGSSLALVAAASGGLSSGLLLAAGIMALRGSPRAVSVLRGWAILRLILLGLALATAAMTWHDSSNYYDYSFNFSFGGVTGVTDPVPQVLLGCIGLVFPVTLLVALGLSDVRTAFEDASARALAS